MMTKMKKLKKSNSQTSSASDQVGILIKLSKQLSLVFVFLLVASLSSRSWMSLNKMKTQFSDAINLNTNGVVADALLNGRNSSSSSSSSSSTINSTDIKVKRLVDVNNGNHSRVAGVQRPNHPDVVKTEEKVTESPTGTTLTFLPTSKKNHTTTIAVKKPKPIPIVILSSLRPQYLEQVLAAIHPDNQNPNTPDWILHSPRYILAHRSNHTDKPNNFASTHKVVLQYNDSLPQSTPVSWHVFEGDTIGPFPPTKPIRSYWAKQVWYRMMRYLFHTLNVTEALILEDDAVLAHDGLLTAAALFRAKQEMPHVHNVAMGGHAGANKVNADPNAYMAVRSVYFQAMAYSMNVTIFDQIDAAFRQAEVVLATRDQAYIDKHENHIEAADWTMELTNKNFLPNLVQLEPSVGRMHHIGIYGMGYDGNGKAHNVFPIPWEFCEATIRDDGRNLESFYADPPAPVVTDARGFICDPPVAFCKGAVGNAGFGANRVRVRSEAERQARNRLFTNSATSVQRPNRVNVHDSRANDNVATTATRRRGNENVATTATRRTRYRHQASTNNAVGAAGNTISRPVPPPPLSSSSPPPSVPQ